MSVIVAILLFAILLMLDFFLFKRLGVARYYLALAAVLLALYYYVI